MGLTKHYGRIEAVAGVNVEAYPGEVLGIVSESGSGKSTVLRLLNLEEMPDIGEYMLNIPSLSGRDLFALDRFARREAQILNIGVVYQNPHLGLRMRFTSSGNVAEDCCSLANGLSRFYAKPPATRFRFPSFR